jgi:hypothetical protein
MERGCTSSASGQCLLRQVHRPLGANAHPSSSQVLAELNQAGEVTPTALAACQPEPTIDALLIQLCLRNDLTLLTTVQDVHAAAKHVAFSLWGAS